MSGSEVAPYVCGGGAAGQQCVRLSIRHLGQLLLILLLDGRGRRPEGAGGGGQSETLMKTQRHKEISFS